jgi:hypothetical protein
MKTRKRDEAAQESTSFESVHKLMRCVMSELQRQNEAIRIATAQLDENRRLTDALLDRTLALLKALP